MAKQKVEKVAPPFLRLREEQSWEKSWKNSFRNERIFGGEVFQASRATLTTRRCNVMVYKHRARVISGPNCYVLDDVSERTRFDDEKIPHECNISFEREREREKNSIVLLFFPDLKQRDICPHFANIHACVHRGNSISCH